MNNERFSVLPRLRVPQAGLSVGRYRAAVRAAALERRTAADAVRLGFWRGLPERLGP